jgi:hypothetical protein
MHPDPVHTCVPPPHEPPLTTQLPVERSQQPPPAQVFPAQQIWPGAPHVEQLPAAHTWPFWQVEP